MDEVLITNLFLVDENHPVSLLLRDARGLGQPELGAHPRVREADHEEWQHVLHDREEEVVRLVVPDVPEGAATEPALLDVVQGERGVAVAAAVRVRFRLEESGEGAEGLDAAVALVEDVGELEEEEHGEGEQGGAHPQAEDDHLGQELGGTLAQRVHYRLVPARTDPEYFVETGFAIHAEKDDRILIIGTSASWKEEEFRDRIPSDPSIGINPICGGSLPKTFYPISKARFVYCHPPCLPCVSTTKGFRRNKREYCRIRKTHSIDDLSFSFTTEFRKNIIRSTRKTQTKN